ncbi:uncharacterized protein DKFZp434B061-like [Papaver somniferum]|uniref:uncharacterized protein DKFZp434B061-like n=1 Tax=Papaver somniferum TaxID=3469 RepID=UPI000E7015A5|nr:uncharacterized protein DKFZp434B061-like [Papaver somniferum]
MVDRHRIPYQTPPSSPYRYPPSKSPDVSPPKGGLPRSSQPDPRPQKTSSASGPRASSTQRGDPPRGSRYAFYRPYSPQRADRMNTPSPSPQCADPMNAPPPTPQRAEPLDVQPLRSVAPATNSSQKSTVPPSTAPVKGKSAKGVVSKADPSRNPPTKRKASDMSPPKRPSSDKDDESDVAPVIRSVSVGKKKVTFKHIDLEAFKLKHELEAFDVKFYAPDDDLTYDLIKNYKYDDFHLLTTVGAFEAGLMLPLYKS